MRHDRWTGYLLIAPAFLALFGVIGYPLIRAFLMSLHEIILTDPGLGQPYVGLANYVASITNPLFAGALWRSAVWTGVNLVIQMVLGLAIALVLNEPFPWRGLARGITLIPWVTPSVVSVLTWRWMYDAQFGVINAALVGLGIVSQPVVWLGNTQTALWAVIGESIWKGTPFVAIMLLAALQAVPNELYDVAKVDGANAWKRLTHITLPLILPTLIIAATLTTIFTFNNFNAIWLMTQGGPLHATETLTILVYNQAFVAFDMGQATAIGMITFFILLVFVAIFGRYYIKSELNL